MILKENLRRVNVITEEERKEWIPKRHQTIKTWEIDRNGMRVVFSRHMYKRINKAHDPKHPVHPGISRVIDSAAEAMVDWWINEANIDVNHPRRFYRKMSDEYYINGTSSENQYGDVLFKFMKRGNFREISGPDIILNINNWKLHVKTVTRSFLNMVRPHGIKNQHIRTGKLQEYTGGAIAGQQEAQEVQEAEEAEEAPKVQESTDFQAKLKGLKTTMISKINSLRFMDQSTKTSLIQSIENVMLEENTKENLLSAGAKIKDVVQSGAVAIPWGKPEDARYFTGEQGYVNATIGNWEKLLRSLLLRQINWEDLIKLDDECCAEARRKTIREMEGQMNRIERMGGRRENPHFQILIEAVNVIRDCTCEDLKLILDSFSDETAERWAINSGGNILAHYHRMLAIRRDWDLCEAER